MKTVPKSILFASLNKGKLEEARKVFQGSSIELIAPSAFEGSRAGVPDVDESSNTYLGNARLKASAFLAWSSVPTLADDTGLEVEAIGGAPGVWSARYAGEGATSKKNIEKLLEVLKNEDDRSARFRCLLCLKMSESDEIVVEAELPGRIAKEPKGDGGFGYDSVFVPNGHEETLAELKGKGSPIKTHRVKALETLIAKLTAK